MTASERVETLIGEYGAADLSVAHLLCDRHDPDAVAVTVVGDAGSADLTYGELRRRSEAVAAGLAELGVGPGTRVAALLPKGVELPVVVLALWRLGAVYVPLFTAFAAQGIVLRLEASGATVLVCHGSQRAKLDPGPDVPADAPWRIVTVGEGAREGDLPFDDLAAARPTGGRPAVQGPDGPFLQLYTSGTTGKPKGVVVPARALASFVAYLEFGLDVRADDVYWNAADPGWAYGLYYALCAPLAAGRRTVLLESNFTPAVFWRVLDEQRVTNVAAAPTVFRALRTAGLPTPEGLVLRAASSAGEPLTPDVVRWAEGALGVAVLDHYGQTELGMVAINGHHPDVRAEVRPSSMGRAMPGFVLAVLEQDGDGPAPAGEVGRVVVDVPASRLMWFTGYDGAPEKSAERFTADRAFYLTGDSGSMDADGHLYFTGRDDDVILMAGYRIGPFDIESVLALHPDVAESAVVGVPDEVRGEVAEAFVVLHGRTGDDELATELQQLVRTRYAAHAYPRRVHFVDALPKTPSGKVQRYLLRGERAR
ncbi:AMP-binding protein [Pseudonocardia sp. KRD-184]|uniref:AMP-binding protein n=1 Tax=Pseudonocardia oceani TaxID=2792013 RepID=A0ABS6U8B1_9PSEU|nr:AMP-binding protein [Pseudonocardia oceani]MBW0088699.1 AMP-binding protein [Pseudonocardia oceani]MBW0095576.1 AMP-binding protein [Pseudonocardia oceani]MBW0110594.1 AMP-binding protein [Pseudonocardia oceani]MBW0120677.1 AMP-binding protein [Pseudonocardia oceani]MBW0128389.1 AMP-binding protein [Pseudonocardia oceani]